MAIACGNVVISLRVTAPRQSRTHNGDAARPLPAWPSLVRQAALRYGSSVRSLPAARWTLALVAGAATLGACRQTLGIDEYFNAPPDVGGSSSADAATNACGLPYGTMACASCAAANCCTASTACATDPTCTSYESCLGNCNGDPKCRSQCTIDNPVGTASDVSALSACLAGKCEAECGLTCGAIADITSEPDAAAACQRCLASSACSQAEACGSSESCDGYLRCPLGFSAVDSTEVCEGTGTDAGAALASATAFTSSCATPCATGNYWACVGHVSWRSPKTATVALNFTVKDFTSGKAVPGVDVAVCGEHDLNCTQPYTQLPTNGTGQVTLPFQNVLNSASQFGLNGHLQLTSPSIVTYLFYWGFPLVEAQLTLYANVVTPAEFQVETKSTGVTPDLTRGTVSPIVYDCLGHPSPGAQVTLSTTFTNEFNTSGVAATVTGQDGIVIFDNVPAGPVDLTAVPPAIGMPSSKVSVNVQAGAVTELLMWPTPNP